LQRKRELKRKPTSAIMVALFLVSIAINAFPVSAQSTVDMVEAMVQEQRVFHTDGFSVPNQAVDFDLAWSFGMINLPDEGSPITQNLEVALDGAFNFDSWWVGGNRPWPDEYLYGPEEIWLSNWWLWYSAPEEVEHQIAFSPESPVVVNELPGYASSRFVDNMDFDQPGIQRVTVTIEFEEDKLEGGLDICVYALSEPLVNAVIIPETADPPATQASSDEITWDLHEPTAGLYSFSVDIEVTPSPGCSVRFVPDVAVYEHIHLEPLPGLPVTSTSVTFENIEVTPEGGSVGNVTFSSLEETCWTDSRRLMRVVSYNAIAESGPIIEVYAPEEIEPYFTMNIIARAIYDEVMTVRHQAIRMMAQDLADLGIEVRLYFMSSEEWINRVLAGEIFDEGGYDVTHFGWGFGYSFSNVSVVAQTMHDLYHSSNIPNPNCLMWDNAENDALLEAAVSSTNETEIEMLLHEWQVLFHEEQPSAVSCYYRNGTGFENVAFNMLHPIFGTGADTPLGQSDPSRAAEAAKYVRQAVSHVINRTWIAENLPPVWQLAEPGITPIFPDSPGFNPSLEPYSLNLTEARRLLSLAGYGTFVEGASPISLLVTDSQGRRVGYDVETSSEVHEIPGAHYSGFDAEPQIVYIPWPQGEYIIEVTGTSTGSFTLAVTHKTEQTFTGVVTPDTTYLYALTILPEGAQTYVCVIDAPVDPVTVSSEVTTVATFTDPNVLYGRTAMWDWGDDTTSTGEIDHVEGTVTGAHYYSIPGVYTVRLTIRDEGTYIGSTQFEYVVAYDPEGGFVTGGGWIDSPEGAYTLDPSLSGKATFGFVSKYKKGADTPTGQTEFIFHVAGLKFHSSNYQWLVVAGARAQYKGSGTINGEGEYGFMLTAIDGQVIDGGGVDRFRIKIWDKATDTIIYDNQLGDTDDADTTTEIKGGSIVIHKSRHPEPV